MRAGSERIAQSDKQELVEQIVRQLIRQHSTAVVLFHQAVAERLGIGPTDHKCLDLLRERGALTGSDLAALTGLTTGAITGVVARLEQAGYVCRESHPYDRRKQVLCVSPQRVRDIQQVFGPIRKEMAMLLEEFDTRQLTAIARFFAQGTDLVYRHLSLLRSPTLRHEERIRDFTSANSTKVSVRTRK